MLPVGGRDKEIEGIGRVCRKAIKSSVINKYFEHRSPVNISRNRVRNNLVEKKKKLIK